MTVKEIAEATGKDESTIRRWVKKVAGKMPVIAGKMHASSPMKPADYTKEETLAIIREGMGEVPAGVYEASAETQKPLQIPNGTQLREFRMIYGPDEAAKRIDMLIGFTGEVPVIPVTKDLGRISKQAYAVEMRVRREQEQKQIEARDNPELFD